MSARGKDHDAEERARRVGRGQRRIGIGEKVGRVKRARAENGVVSMTPSARSTSETLVQGNFGLAPIAPLLWAHVFHPINAPPGPWVKTSIFL